MGLVCAAEVDCWSGWLCDITSWQHGPGQLSPNKVFSSNVFSDRDSRVEDEQCWKLVKAICLPRRLSRLRDLVRGEPRRETQTKELRKMLDVSRAVRREDWIGRWRWFIVSEGATAKQNVEQERVLKHCNGFTWRLPGLNIIIWYLLLLYTSSSLSLQSRVKP